MKVRFFQIIIPFVALLMIFFQIRAYNAGKSSTNETALLFAFWSGVLGVAVYPDFFSNLIAKTFGIKDNVNAIIFFALAILFYLQLQLYKAQKKHDQALTELARKIALENAERD